MTPERVHHLRTPKKIVVAAQPYSDERSKVEGAARG
jgi:hypothetical protein